MTFHLAFRSEDWISTIMRHMYKLTKNEYIAEERQSRKYYN